MTISSTKMRQLVDWSAAFWAGLSAGLLFLLLLLLLTPLLDAGNSWVVIRLLASIVLGPDILAPPATFDMPALIFGLLTHFTLSILFTMLVAYIVHQWGILLSIIVGALIGLALYAINFYTFTFFFPWFFAMRSWAMIAAHIGFGALAGAIYEALEVVEFVPDDE